MFVERKGPFVPVSNDAREESRYQPGRTVKYRHLEWTRLEKVLELLPQVFELARVHIGQDSLGVLCKEARCEHGEEGYIRLQPYSRLIIEEAARALR